MEAVTLHAQSKCFDVHFGWFEVLFLGEQVLYGTYGGSEGKIALPDRGALTWLYVAMDQHLPSVASSHLVEAYCSI